MTLNKLLTATLAVQLVIVGTLLIAPAQSRPQPASATEKTDFEDCPDGYFWRGGCVQVTGCPYGDSIPMDMCDKFAPQPQPEPVKEQPKKTAPVEVYECGGK